MFQTKKMVNSTEEVKGARDLQDFTQNRLQNSLKYEGKRFEYLVYEDTLLFNLNCVGNILGIANPRTSIDTADDRYVRLITNSDVSETYYRKLNNKGELFLTEDGLFRIIITSRSRNINAFQDWLRDKALPSIKAQLSINQNIMGFSKDEFGEVRTLAEGENIWFCLVDICRVLDLSNPSKVINDFPDDLTNSYPILDNLGRLQNMTFVNESGLYRTIFKSRKEKALEFQDWVCSEVIPSIRKHGAYITEDVINDNKKLNESIQAIREQYKEKIDFADAFLASEDSAYIAVFADYLTKNGVKMGRNQLFKWFKDKKVLVMHGDDYFPSARYMKMGLFDLEASTISKGNGRKSISHTVKITPKGMKYFMEKIQANKADKTQKQIIDFIQLTLFD